MQRIRLIHWKADEAEERAAMLQGFGYAVDSGPLTAAGLRGLRADPPDAVVIDLSRAPSLGRDLGLNLRKYAATRHVPLVFAEGVPEKVIRIQELLPDAVYTTWAEMRDALQSAVDNPPADPVAPASTMAGYAGTPLPRKLGIKPGSVVALVSAPKGFEETLGDLPEDVTLTQSARPASEVTLWFPATLEDLKARIEDMVPCAEKGGLWIIWPKKASGIVSDLSQTVVRETGLAAGLVDFKVAAIDATWSGLRFSRRKTSSLG